MAMDLQRIDPGMRVTSVRQVPSAMSLTGDRPFEALLRQKVSPKPEEGIPHAQLAPDRPYEALLRPRAHAQADAKTEAQATQPTKDEQDQRKKVREAAEEFVSMALVEPVLAKMRAMNSAAEPFAPGAYEKAFAPFVDSAWSKGIVRAEGWSLVERVEQWMTRNPAEAEVGHG